MLWISVDDMGEFHLALIVDRLNFTLPGGVLDLLVWIYTPLSLGEILELSMYIPPLIT